MAEAICRACYGRRGMGKSTRVKAMIAGEKRVIAFDPTGEYGRELGFTVCNTVGDVRAAMVKGWRKGFHIAFQPQSGDRLERFHNLASFIWQARAGYAGNREADLLTVVVEEAWLALPNQTLPRGKGGGLDLALQGRHRGIGLVLVSQSMATVNAAIRRQCAEVYIFGMTDPLDVQATDRLCGKGIGAKVQALPPHRYIKWAEGVLSEGENRLSKKSRK